MTTMELQDILALGETLTVEFKSDRDGLPDSELIAAVVGLANTEGGDLYIGVEDDGTVTGLHPRHSMTEGLGAMVANRTNPAIAVRVDVFTVGDRKIARISVPKSRQLVSSSEGLLLRRRLMANGRPEAVPFYPHEFTQRLSSMRVIDPSAVPLVDADMEALDPLERQRVRDSIRRYGGDQSLLPLSDTEFDGAIGFTTRFEGKTFPSMAGLLMIGAESAIRAFLPSHEAAFQVMDGSDIRVNEFFRKPLLRTYEEIESQFRPYLSEREVQVGLFRVPIPNYDRKGFREALVNAFVHRDYSRLGAVHVRLDSTGLLISNPGGFVEGVTLQNLLVTEPRPRNPLLANIVKRIGLAERTGRGIDRIFEGLVRFGRPLPDYSRSDSGTVVVRVSDAEADIAFLEMVISLEERRGPLHLDSLLILSRLREERRIGLEELSGMTQKGEVETRACVERLIEEGLVEAHGNGRMRDFILSASLYRSSGRKAAYVRQAGFDPIQQEQMVLKYVRQHGSIKRSDVVDLCRISGDQAAKLLAKLKKDNKIEQHGKNKGAIYVPGSNI